MSLCVQKKKSLDQKTMLMMGGVVKKSTLSREEGRSQSSNVLDASAPSKRGKERETPKPKKPSPLKKVRFTTLQIPIEAGGNKY